MKQWFTRLKLALLEAGQGVIEYIIIIAVVAIGSIAIINSLDSNVDNVMNNAGDHIKNTNPGSSYEFIEAEGGEVKIVASAYSYYGSYDGNYHGGTIEVYEPADGYVIKYGTENGKYPLTTEPRYKDIGSYTVYFQITAANCDPVIGNYKIEISGAKLEVPTVDGDYTYNGKTRSPSISAYDLGLIEISGATSARDVGTYTIYFDLLDKDTYTWEDGTTTSKSATWEINKFDLANAIIDELPEQHYDNGNEIKPVPTVKISSTVTLTAGKEYVCSYSNNREIGTASLTITAVDGSNCTGSKTISFAIQEGLITVRASDYFGTYDGSAHSGTLTVSGPSTYTIKYGVASGQYTQTAKPTYTDAGVYTVYYQVTANKYKTAIGSFGVNIERGKISTVPSQKGSAYYSGKSVSPTWNNYNSSQLTIGGTTSAVAIGSYTATFTPTRNYTWSDGTTAAKTATWKIIQGTGTRTYTATMSGSDGWGHSMSVTYTIKEDWDKGTNKSTCQITEITFSYYQWAYNSFIKSTNNYSESGMNHGNWNAYSTISCYEGGFSKSFGSSESYVIAFDGSSVGTLYENSSVYKSPTFTITHNSAGNATLTLGAYWSWENTTTCNNINYPDSLPAYPARGGISNGNGIEKTVTIQLTNTKS